MFKISPEWVTGPEQGKSSGRTATFSLWTGMFRDGISSIPGETVTPMWLGRHFIVCENRVYHEKVRTTPITPILDKLLEYKRSWIQHVNRMPWNRLPRVMKHYCPTGRRNHGRSLKRLLGTWDRNGSTSGPIPWEIYDDDDDYYWFYWFCKFPYFVTLAFMRKTPWRWCKYIETCSSTLWYTLY